MEKESKRILVVDDEDALRSKLQNLLCSHGFFVQTASSGRKAIELAADLSNKIDLVLLDLRMPVMDGEETFKELRNLRPTLKVVLCTSFREDDVLARFVDVEVSGILKKPYSLKKLLTQINEILAKKS